NQQTDSDIVKKIAGEAGIAIGTVDSSGTVHEHVSQINITDWEFMRARGREIGFTVSVRDGKLSFRRGGGSGSRGPDLGVGRELISFRPRVSGAQQVKEVEARGWDYKAKQKVTHTARAGTTSVSLDTSGWAPGALATTLGAKKFVTCDRPIGTTAEAEVIAKATAEEISSAFAEAEGIAVGDPRLTTGKLVTIAGAGPFDGNWMLSHTRHRFDEDGYHTEFEVAGRQERSMLGLSSLGATGAGANPVYGVVVGVVTNVKDPEKLGRVKLKFPWLSDDFESNWARVCLPGAGKERGLFVVPEVDDEVLVVFEHGDVRMPYVLGGLYNGKDKPPAVEYCDQTDGKIKIRRWATTKGHQITISDYDDEDHILIKTKDNEYGIAISKSKDHIYLSSKGKIVLDGPGGIEIKGGDVTVSGGKIKLEASGALEMKGASAKLEGTGETTIKGSVVKLN
ncbi:MAG TPA: VgrG-related protein, partial [Ilumatobacteraceae bacterium]|nr:VgrG-related protein [Ilumatobacteraceae bacterium]